MKTFLLVLASCLATLTAQSTPVLTDDPAGIRFFKGSWNDVLAEAKRQNKPVFVDVYTTWCGPCKLMAKQAFPDPKVAEKFNANFINYQIDAEKGEGVTIAKQYAVDAYPTSLFVLGDGNLVYKTSGYSGIQGMMAEADKAIEEAKDPKPLTAWEQEYKSGQRDADFLYGYLKKMASLEKQDETVVAEYIKSIPDTEWLSEKNIGWYSRTITSVKSDDFEKLVQEIARLSQSPATAQRGADVFSGLQQIIGKSWQQAVSTKNEQLMQQAIDGQIQAIHAFRPEIPATALDERATAMRVGFYGTTRMFDKYRALVVPEAKRLMATPVDVIRKKDEANFNQFDSTQPDSVKHTDDYKQMAAMMKTAEAMQTAAKLNDIAWSYYENFTDRTDLNQALAWSARSLELQRNGSFMDTYAHLLYKLGRKTEATKVQQEAIALEKKAGNDTTHLEKALAGMK